MLSALNLIFILLGLFESGIGLQYNGYKIYETVPVTRQQCDFLNELSEQTSEIDFFSLTKLANVPATAMVSPKYQNLFERALTNYGMEFIVINQNVSQEIELERQQNSLMRSLVPNGRVTFDRYHRFDEINQYLDQLANKYPDRVVVADVGKSYQGRQIKSVTISNGDGRKNKKVIFIDAGIHAREWIAPATALYVIKQLTENYEENKNLLTDYDWIILPCVNPDGYEYTHVSDRFWRKTRTPGSILCYGTDGNRNFDFHWGEVGASPSSCSDTYRGSKAFSEPETQIVRDIMHSLEGRAKFYLTLHSYGNYLLYPWGFTSALPETWEDIHEVAQAGAESIRSATGNRFTVGSSTNVLYAAAGGSDDYALGVVKIPIAITMELQGNGFDPKPSQIKGFVEESWIGMKMMATKVITKY